jgi:hypothetical protein
MSAEDNWATTADLMEPRNLLTRDADHLRLLEAVVRSPTPTVITATSPCCWRGRLGVVTDL